MIGDDEIDNYNHIIMVEHTKPPHTLLQDTTKFIKGCRYYCQVYDDIKELKCISEATCNYTANFNAGVISLVNDVWVGLNEARTGAIYKYIDSVSLSINLSPNGYEIASGLVNNTYVELWSTRLCPDNYDDGPWYPLGRCGQLIEVIRRREPQLAEWK
jgi:hypothetical protein